MPGAIPQYPILHYGVMLNEAGVQLDVLCISYDFRFYPINSTHCSSLRQEKVKTV